MVGKGYLRACTMSCSKTWVVSDVGDFGQVLGEVCLFGQLGARDVPIQIHGIVQAYD